MAYVYGQPVELTEKPVQFTVAHMEDGGDRVGGAGLFHGRCDRRGGGGSGKAAVGSMGQRSHDRGSDG